MHKGDKAIVLFSGGQDSATCLAWALSEFDEIETIGFDYGQNHRVELQVREHFISEIQFNYPEWSKQIGEDHVLNLGVLGQISDTSLTADKKIEFDEGGLPNTFVPARNILFASLAAAIAYRRNAKHIVLGVCETDYSGYPDCRDDTMKALQVTLNLGMASDFVIHTPLMWKTKAATWKMAEVLGGETLVNIIRKHTHTCYNGNREKFHEWGYGCDDCPACELRRSGWLEYQEKD